MTGKEYGPLSLTFQPFKERRVFQPLNDDATKGDVNDL